MTCLKFYTKHAAVLFALTCLMITVNAQEQKHGSINRQVVVQRHNLKITNKNEPGPSQVGNGDFAYGFDITGMQTFSDRFTTMSHWGWHSTKMPAGTTLASFIKPKVDTHGRLVSYDLPNPDQPELTKWLQSNTHRLNLGRIGLWIKTGDGTEAKIDAVENPVQHVDLWTGIAESNFTIEGQQVKVTTTGDANNDIVGFKIESALLAKGRLGVFIEFPYRNLNNFSNGADYKVPTLHQTTLTSTGGHSAVFNRKLDETTYQVKCNWTGTAKIEKQKDHHYTLIPAGKQDVHILLFPCPDHQTNTFIYRSKSKQHCGLGLILEEWRDNRSVAKQRPALV